MGGLIRNVHVGSANEHGLGIITEQGRILDCDVGDVSNRTADTYSCVYVSGSGEGSRIAGLTLSGVGADHLMEITSSSYLRVGGMQGIADATNASYNFTSTANGRVVWEDGFWMALHDPRAVLTAPTVGSDRLPVPGPVRIVAVLLSVDTAPTGAAIIVDMNVNGTSIFPTTAKPTIAAGANMGTILAIPDNPWVDILDYVTMDIDQVGSGVAGGRLTANFLAVNEKI